MRDGRLEGLQAIIEGQQRVSATRDDSSCLVGGQHRRVWGLWPHRTVLKARTLPPLGHRLRIDPARSAPGAKPSIAVLLLGWREWSWRSREGLVP